MDLGRVGQNYSGFFGNLFLNVDIQWQGGPQQLERFPNY